MHSFSCIYCSIHKFHSWISLFYCSSSWSFSDLHFWTEVGMIFCQERKIFSLCFNVGMLPTDYVHACVNRVSIDPVIQRCASIKLWCGFINILYYSNFCNVVQKHWLWKWNLILQFITVVRYSWQCWKNRARLRPPESL